MKKCRVVFSFDDARVDTFNAINIAKRFGIKSTLNVTTAYVDNNISTEFRPSSLPAMSVEQVISLQIDDFVELACHSDNHINDFGDIVCGREKLQYWLNDASMLGFASPSSKIDFNKNSLEKFKNNQFKYVRIGPKSDRHAKVYRVLRKLSRIFGLKALLYITYKDTLQNTIEDNYLVHGIPVLNDNSVDQFKYIILRSIKEEFDCVFIFHSILNKGEQMSSDTWSWDMEKYEKLCHFLKDMHEQNNVEFCITSDLITIEK